MPPSPASIPPGQLTGPPAYKHRLNAARRPVSQFEAGRQSRVRAVAGATILGHPLAAGDIVVDAERLDFAFDTRVGEAACRQPVANGRNLVIVSND
jgi:hypothetical protein